MGKPVRVRFAPSPTGLLHIGGVRTALFNYLFAKKNNGVFILRLEDTDRERFVQAGVEQIEKSLAWLGLTPDEGYWLGEHQGDVGPYVQSERLPHYEKYAKELVEQGLAYYSRISPEDFNQLKQNAITEKRPFVYKQEFEPPDDGKTENYPIRLKIKEGTANWRDDVRGDFSTPNGQIDDFVIIKADGYPTYNFANVIDDHMMGISHVIRGDEFIASTAKHILLYEYFGWEVPSFVHLPTILGPDGKKKLSKRDGDVDVLDYQKQGYLPEALINFLALLGWNDGTEQEIFTLDELTQKFSPERIEKSPAVFDKNRLDWMNGKWIREKLSIDEFTKRLDGFVPSEWASDKEYFERVIELDRERIKTLTSVKDLISFFFEEIDITADKLTAKTDKEKASQLLQNCLNQLEKTEFKHDTLENMLRKLAEDEGVKAGELFYLLRITLTGRTEAPGIFDTMIVLGKEKVAERITAAISKLT